MNEDITQEIYYCLIEAGYDEKKASRLCNNKQLKPIINEYKRRALLEARTNFIEYLKMIIDFQN